MRKLKLFGAVIMASMMLTLSVAQAAYSDLGGYYEGAVKSLVSQGILDGQGTFNGASKATRAFVAEMVAKGLGLDPLTPDTPTFKDVPKSNSSYGYIEAMYSAGIVSGDKDSGGNMTGTFRPNDPVNRVELMKIVVLGNELDLVNPSSGTFADVPKDAWFYQYVETAYKNGLVTGYKDASGKSTGVFGSADGLLRQDTAVVVFRSQDAEVKSTGEGEVSEGEASEGEEKVSNEVTESYSGGSSLTLNYSSALSEIAKVDYKNVRHGSGVYTGSLPAPEGVVVNGSAGLNVTVKPTGDGKYRYDSKLWVSESLVCRDPNRNLAESTGVAFENAFDDGFNQGKSDYDGGFKLDDTVPAEHSAQSKTYKDAYADGWNGISKNTFYLSCYEDDVLSNKDYATKFLASRTDDGWVKWNDFPDATSTFVAPPGTFSTTTASTHPYAPPTGSKWGTYTINLRNLDDNKTGIEEMYVAEYPAPGAGEPKTLAEWKTFMENTYYEGAIPNATDPKDLLLTSTAPAVCYSVDPRNPMRTTIETGKLDPSQAQSAAGLEGLYGGSHSELQGLGKSYRVVEETFGSNKGLHLTEVFTCNVGQGFAVALLDSYVFVTSDGHLIQVRLDYENGEVATDANMVEKALALEGSDYYDKEFLTQMFSAWEGLEK